MLILTAFNSSYADIGTLCVQSIMRYVLKHPHMRFVANLIPDDFDRPASWYKLRLLKEHLPDHDFVLWVDADALFIGSDDVLGLMSPTATINLCEDENGVNGGIVGWRNCPEAFALIDRLESMHEEFREHKWWEQGALMSILPEVDVNLVPKHILNAYELDVGPKTQIIHFPGMGDERLGVMQKYMEAA